MNLGLLCGQQRAFTLHADASAACKEIPTRTTVKITVGPCCSYRSPAGRDERRGRRAPGPGFEKSSAVVTQGGRSFGPHSSCLKEDDRRHAEGRAGVFSQRLRTLKYLLGQARRRSRRIQAKSIFV